MEVDVEGLAALINTRPEITCNRKSLYRISDDCNDLQRWSLGRHHRNGRWEARVGHVGGSKYVYLGAFGISSIPYLFLFPSLSPLRTA
ncbi:hypothetical protein MUK42_20085 [Musa troglodytarum]|uniref:Uncharacterized protein n=1 Tax=Musa troglodytarum TaxID=320322 RepID=A0A9E7FDI0_9LILI|nr:hypothetical protein MUK42_20085 [Musa troglodytarum]